MFRKYRPVNPEPAERSKRTVARRASRRSSTWESWAGTAGLSSPGDSRNCRFEKTAARMSPNSSCLKGWVQSTVSVRRFRGPPTPMSPEEEQRFMVAKRPDGPVFGFNDAESNVSHIVMPTFVRGRDHGWFFAFCYRCNRDERHNMDIGRDRYFDPFTGETLTYSFEEACKLGLRVREEWVRRRKLLRESKRRTARQSAS